MAQSLVSTTESWDAAAEALLKSASEGPTTILNKILLEKINTICPFDSSTTILDNGCGVAQVLGRLIDMYCDTIPPHTRLVAADLSPGMIKIVEERKVCELSRGIHAWGRVEAKVWDAQDLKAEGVPDESFSHVTAGLLLFMVERPQAVLEETRRVLKSNGGIFGMTSFVSAEWMNLIGEALNEVRPGTRLPDIPVAWASVSNIRRQLEDAGFKVVFVEEVQTFYEFEDPETMTRFNMANIPPVKMITADMSEEDIEKAIQLMLKWLAEKFPEGKGRLEGTAIVGIGMK